MCTLVSGLRIAFEGETGMNSNDTELQDDYYDMEEELDRGEIPESCAKILRNMADSIMSGEQLADKGKFLGRYKSGGIHRTYIDVYERAFIGRAEISKYGNSKTEKICFGYACLSEVLVEDGVLYLVMNDENIYRLRHLKLVQEAAYRLNEQKGKTKEG